MHTPFSPSQHFLPFFLEGQSSTLRGGPLVLTPSYTSAEIPSSTSDDNFSGSGGLQGPFLSTNVIRFPTLLNRQRLILNMHRLPQVVPSESHRLVDPGAATTEPEAT